MFQPKEYPRLVCKVCGGLMHTTAPRDPQNVAVHYYCGLKLPKGANDHAMLRMQE